MSVRVMTAVFDRYPHGGGEMLLALSLADHAHDDGTHIYPSVDSLSKKTRQSVRTVQYQLKSMLEAGWLVLTNEGDGRRGQHREYRISLDWLKGAEFAPSKNMPETAPMGAIHDIKGCKQVHPLYNREESPVNHQSASRASRISAIWQLPQKFGQWAIEEYPEWTPEFVRGRGEKFRDHWCAIGGRAGLKTDWLATWRNFCRGEAEFIARTGRTQSSSPPSPPWWSSDPLIIAEGSKHRLTPLAGESMFAFKGRVQVAVANVGKTVVPPPVPSKNIKAPEPSEPAVSASPEAIAARSAVIKTAKAMIRKSVTRIA